MCCVQFSHASPSIFLTLTQPLTLDHQMEKHSLLLRLTAMAYYCLNTAAISPVIGWVWQNFSFEENTLFKKLILNLWIHYAFVHKKTTLTSFQCFLCMPQRKILSQHSAESHWQSMAHFCECNIFKDKAKIYSQSPSVFTLKASELVCTLFIQLLSLINAIVATVPINENELCKNVPNSPLHKSLSV